MKNTIFLTFAVAGFGGTAFPADQRIAFERNDAVYIANLDGTGEKKAADGIFPAISPDGTRIAFNTVEKTSDTTCVRHMAIVDVATGKLNVFKDVPSDLPDVFGRKKSDATREHARARRRIIVSTGLWPVSVHVCLKRGDGPQGRGYIRRI